MYVSTRLVGAFLVVAVLCAVLPVPVFAVMGVGLFVIVCTVIADIVLAPDARTMGLQREAPEVMGTGRRADVELRLHNPTPRTVDVEVRDASPPSLVRRPFRHRVRLAPGAWSRLEGSMTPERRGTSSVGPVTVRTSGPFRLAGRQRTIPLTNSIKVYPRLPGRTEVELRAERARMLMVGERSSTHRGGGTEFDSLREYHPDDEFRRINWRATARASRPVSNVFREERNQQVFVLLDAGRTMAATVGSISRFEYALDAAFAVAELAVRTGDHVGMEAFSGRVLAMMGPKGGSQQPRRILDLLFALEPTLEASDYRGAFAALLNRYRRRALLVLLTELGEESVMESLFDALPVVLSHHVVVVGSVIDPQLVVAATAIPESSETAYLKAAAAAALEARARSAGHLRRMGVAVEDRAGHLLAGALADRYLRIKSAGRL